MDLKQLMAKKRKAVKEAAQRKSKKSKYLRTKEVEEAEAAAREEEAARLKAEKEALARAHQAQFVAPALTSTSTPGSSGGKGKGEEGSMNAATTTTATTTATTTTTAETTTTTTTTTTTATTTLAVSYVKAQLRARGEVVTFFGESDAEREQRWRHVQLHEGEYGTGELNNEFSRAMKEESQRLLEESAGGARDGKTRVDYSAVYKGKEPADAEERVWFFFAELLDLWRDDLEARSVEERMTREGKRVTATFTQTCVYLNPLFEDLASKSVHTDILRGLEAIVTELKNRNYQGATDHYLGMSIGNAAWPIGVTMVGIHVRSGRERISSNKVAHVLKNEVTRKYIQSVKRLISYCQSKFPPTVTR